MTYYLDKLKDEILYFRAKRKRDKICGKSNSKPFFIVSCGRSGTTLLRKQLIDNSLVHIPPESDDNIPQSIIYFIKTLNKPWDEIVSGIINLWTHSKCFKFWDLNLNENIDSLLACDKNTRNLVTIIDYIYSEHGKKHNPDAITWGDKTPYLVYRLKWIKLLYPNSKIIHMIRDGRNVVLSRMENFNESLDLASDKWNWSIQEWEEFKSPNKHIIKYEDLVEKNSQTITNLIEMLNLEINSQPNVALNLGDDILPHHSGLHEEINKNHLYDFRTRKKSLIGIIEKKLQHNLVKYGYL